MSQDVEFDDSASWYSLPTPTPTPDNYDNPIPEDKVNELDLIRDEEEDIGALEESPISFRLSGLNESLSRSDQRDDESASSGDLAMYSTHKEPRRRYIRKRKGKMKISECNTVKGASDPGKSDTIRSDDGPQAMRLDVAKKALK